MYVIAAQIAAKQDDFIQSYRVVSEAPSDDGLRYTVTVEATISVRAVQAALTPTANSPGGFQRPTVLLAIAEQGIAEFTPYYWWGGQSGGQRLYATQAIAETLGARGFPIVAHQTASQDSAFTTLFNHPELTDGQALDLASRLGATVVVHGQARASAGTAW